MKYCLVCDKPVIFTSKYHPNQKYCSFSCGQYAKSRLARKLDLRRPSMSILHCKVCHVPFNQTHPNNILYCSRRCNGLANSRKRNGHPIDKPLKAPKGTGYITANGYKILSKKHPNSSKRGQIFEHVYIMSEYLRRPLKKHETVHHKNGVRNDNRIDNLELWSNSHPYGQRVEDKINWCKEFLEQYGYKTIIKEEENERKLKE